MFDDFTESIDPYWSQTCIGTGTLHSAASALRMSIPNAKIGEYSDAQIDDYAGRSRANFPGNLPCTWKCGLAHLIQQRQHRVPLKAAISYAEQQVSASGTTRSLYAAIF